MSRGGERSRHRSGDQSSVPITPGHAAGEMGWRVGEGISQRGETPWRDGGQTRIGVDQEDKGEKLTMAGRNNALEKFHCTQRKRDASWGRGVCVKRGVLFV